MEVDSPVRNFSRVATSLRPTNKVFGAAEPDQIGR